MLDLKFIRENPEEVAKGLSAKGVTVDLQKLLSLFICNIKSQKFTVKIE